MKKVLRFDENDNVAVALEALQPGDELSAGSGCLELQAQEAIPPHIGRDFVEKARGPRSRTIRVAEGKAGHEGAAAHEFQRLLEILLALSGKAHDEIRGQGHVRPRGAQGVHQFHEAGRVVAATHTGQYGVGTGL